MDPVAVMKMIWRQKWFAAPAVILTLIGAAYFYFEGPRTYEVSAAYAFANPQVPTEKEIDADPSLLQLNSDNPYLRSTDPNLIANVVITRLNAPQAAERLEKEGLETEYTVSPGALGGGLVVSINASGESPAAAITATALLGSLLEDYLYESQKVNGADDRFLFTPLLVESPSDPTEKISSRLRTVLVVGAAGIVLIFAAISLGTWVDSQRSERRQRQRASETIGAAPGETPSADRIDNDDMGTLYASDFADVR